MGVSAAFAQQATVTLNNYDSNVQIMYVASAGTAAVPAPLTANINVQLMGGPSATQLQPVTLAGTTTSLIPVSGAAGYFDGGVGVVPGVTAGATATFELWAFVGNDPNAATAQLGKSAQWTQATGSWPGAPTPPTGPTLNIPASGVTVGGAGPAVPEPSTIALGLLGLGALLIRRRK